MPPLNTGTINDTVNANGNFITVDVYYRGDPEGVAYNPLTQPIMERGTPPCALLAVNPSTQVAPCVITEPNGTTHPINVPPGTTRLSAAQLAAIGITTRDAAQSLSLSSP